MTQRTVVWFSCGAASAVAAYYAVQNRSNVHVVYCDTSASEHPDNARFLRDVEKWIGQKVEVLRSPDYRTVDDVIERTRYMSGIAGARCTVELKKRPRFAYQQPDDLHVFGLTADEGPRIESFVKRNPELHLWWLLRDLQLTKTSCLNHLRNADIVLPTLYLQGYRNNNCIGCVKASSADYWNKIRADYPEVFARRAAQERELGVTLAKWKGKRIYLDELPNRKVSRVRENVSCGPECGLLW